MYLTYAEYQNMGGMLDETAFNNFEFDAESLINWYTFNRLKNDDIYPEEVKKCMYRLIELVKLEADAMMLGRQTQESGGTTTSSQGVYISSQSNDGVSISYNSINASELFNKISSTEKGNVVEVTIQRYLQGVTNSLGRKLLYRGLYPNE